MGEVSTCLPAHNANRTVLLAAPDKRGAQADQDQRRRRRRRRRRRWNWQRRAGHSTAQPARWRANSGGPKLASNKCGQRQVKSVEAEVEEAAKQLGVGRGTTFERRLSRGARKVSLELELDFYLLGLASSREQLWPVRKWSSGGGGGGGEKGRRGTLPPAPQLSVAGAFSRAPSERAGGRARERRAAVAREGYGRRQWDKAAAGRLAGRVADLFFTPSLAPPNSPSPARRRLVLVPRRPPLWLSSGLRAARAFASPTPAPLSQQSQKLSPARVRPFRAA